MGNDGFRGYGWGVCRWVVCLLLSYRDDSIPADGEIFGVVHHYSLSAEKESELFLIEVFTSMVE